MQGRPVSSYNAMASAEENARFMTRVYGWMCFGLILTFLVALYISETPAMVELVFANPFVFWGLIIAQLGAVFALSLAINKMSSVTAALLYFAYAALTGCTLSVIFLAYTRDSIANVFLITSFAFGGLSAFGYFTKRDLGPVGAFCSMALFGLIGMMLVSMFFPSVGSNPQLQMITSVAGVVIFAGLTAYDTQKIKAMNIIGNEGTDEDRKEAIVGALTLYLDFINLFLMLLRLMGRRK